MNQEKDNRIPFDWELYQKGYEAVYRNGKKPEEVLRIDTKFRKNLITSISQTGDARSHWSDGNHERPGPHEFDLLLIPPQPKPEPEMFVNKFKNTFGLHFITPTCFDSIEAAKSDVKENDLYIGTYKLVRVDEK